MAKTDKQALGQRGETIACAFLEEQGATILYRNYRSGRSELDIIALKEKTLIIAEVKSFYTQPLEAPELRVDKQKQRNIIRGAYGFLAENPQFQGLDVRLDVLIIDFSRYPANVIHYPGAFIDEDGY